MKKKIIVALLAVAMVFSLSACSLSDLFGGSKEVEGYESTNGIEGYTTTSDGRKVDGYQIAFIGDTVSTAWFKFTVNSVKFVSKYEDITADSGYNLAVANITIKSTYDGDMPLYYNDFWIAWDLEASSWSYGEELAMYKSGDDLGDSITMQENESLKADFVFQVPEDAESPYVLEFYEYYADDVWGNDFFIIFE